MATHHKFNLVVNGQEHIIRARSNTPLLYVLRNDLKCTGVKFGCGTGNCGACMVLMGESAVNSCLTPVSAAKGVSITTIEGLPCRASDSTSDVSRLQQAFLDEQAMQCGYCIPGIIMTVYSFCEKHQTGDVTIESILNKLSDNNLCRCGSHPRIARAISRYLNDKQTTEEPNRQPKTI